MLSYNSTIYQKVSLPVLYMFHSQDKRVGNKTVLYTNQISPFSFFVMLIGNCRGKKKILI